MSNISALSDTAVEASSSIDRMPGLIDQTREAVKADLEGRLFAQAFFQDERLKTLFALQQERIETMAAVHEERLAVTGEFREQEILVMNDFEASSKKAIQDLDARGRGLINFIFLRALELILLALVLCFLLAWALLRVFRFRHFAEGVDSQKPRSIGSL